MPHWVSRARRLRVSRGLLLIAVVGAAAAATVVALVGLYRDSAASQREEAVVAQTETRLSNAMAGEWRSLADPGAPVDPDWHELNRLLTVFGQVSDDSARDRAFVLRSVPALETAAGAARALHRLGQLDAARRTATGSWTNIYEPLRTTLRRMEARAAHEAHAEGRLASFGTVGGIGLVALLIGMILTLVRGERRGRLVARTHELAANASEQRLHALVAGASDVIMTCDAAGTILTAAGATGRLLGRPPAELVGADAATLALADDAEELRSAIAAVGAEPGGERSLSWRVAAAEPVRALETVARNLLDEPAVRAIVLTSRDVTEREALEFELRHRAFHDPLTQLPNRALFSERAEHALEGGSEGSTVAVAYVDLDDFKLVNDKYGHAVGDELLSGAASRLRGCVRSGDTAARLGGDEFGVLFQGLGDATAALRTAERLLTALSEPYVIHGEPVLVKPSVGLGIARPRQLSGAELLRRADVAMYVAKRHGKGRLEVFDDEPAGAPGGEADEPGGDPVSWFMRSDEQRDEITALLARDDSIRPVFQPILDLRSGLVAKYEALARFDVADSDRPPNAWFSQAHRCGLGLELELHAVRAALAIGPPSNGAKLCLNLSPSAIVAPETHAALPDDLSEIVLEVTENELVTEGSRLERALHDLRARGAELAVDDIGAGYAGLKQLMRLRPDLIKLDRSLVDGVSGEPAKSALVDSMVRYGRRIGASVCAEGIESLDDLRTLADLDVTYGQGFGIARPAPAWAEPAADAVAGCMAARDSLLRDGGLGGERHVNADVRLDVVMRSIFSASAVEDLDVTLGLVARELHADEVLLMRSTSDPHTLESVAWHGGAEIEEFVPISAAKRHALETLEAIQVLVSDPAADGDEIGEMFIQGISSRLMVPVTAGNTVVGLLTAANVLERPWSRTEVHRARVMAHALGAFLVTVTGVARSRATVEPLPFTLPADAAASSSA